MSDKRKTINKQIILDGCILSSFNEKFIEEYYVAGVIRICPGCGTANDYQWIAIRPPKKRGGMALHEIQCLVCSTMSQEDNWMVG